MSVRPFLVNGEWRTGEGTFEVHSPYDDAVVAEIGVPTAEDVEEAVATAAETFEASRNLPVHARADALDHISRRLGESIDQNAELIAKEGGKPLKWAKVEATRAVSTFRWASEILRRGDDELIRLDTEASLGSRVGLIRRFPYGPVLGITPFNFPLNLVAHKVAPSLAVGAPIVVKPASATPLGSLRLAELFDETDLPHGMFQVLPVSSKVADGMARDERFRKISFTGSSDIGWYLKGLDPKKRVTLELGGNAGVIVHSDADLDLAAQRVAFGGYYQAGQSCISVQRVMVQSEVYEDFAARLVKQVESLKVGDPMDPTVDVGPVIQKSEVGRIDEWVQEAVTQGATVLTGGKARGALLLPHADRGRPARDEGLPRGDLRPGRDDQPVPDLRGRDRGRERLAVRAAGGRVHQRHQPGVPGPSRHRRRRRDRERRLGVPSRPDAVRRFEGLRVRT